MAAQYRSALDVPYPQGRVPRAAPQPRFEVGVGRLQPPPRQMLGLLPWRWPHWVLLLVGPLFIITYLSLLSWTPIDDAMSRLSIELEQRGTVHDTFVRAEILFGLASLLLLSPFFGMTVVFFVLFGMVVAITTFGPLFRLVCLPDWVLPVLLGGAATHFIYARTDLWLPWTLWFLDRLGTIYLVLTL